ncbi:MAG: glycosyltransferase family 39 protein [Phycisphaerales bacterium]|nr:MAG: glycosyltransferase family 39 protein [Phycisphaerales bacterium]
MPRNPFFHPRLRLALIGLLFTGALGIRVFRITDPPMNFHRTRQYRSALIARAYYYATSKHVPEWKKEVATLTKQRQGTLEPPIIETIACLAYHLTGGERLWVPRLLSAVFWLVGGGFLYALTKRLLSADAAILSTAYYLLLPYGVIASRSFQPDPMLVMALIISLFTMVWYHDRPSTRCLIAAASTSALAILIKPVCVFPILGAFVSLSIWRLGVRKFLTSPAVLVFAAVSLLPGAMFYLYGILIAGFLKAQALSSFMPRLLLSTEFWIQWLRKIEYVFGYPTVVVALLGLLALRRTYPGALLVGLWIGYLVYGAVFTYHIHSHDYYQLQFIPTVALSVAALGALLFDWLTEPRLRLLCQVAVIGEILVAGGLSIRDAHTKMTRRTHRQFVQMVEEIGEIVHHSPHTIFLSKGYGRPLQYHGELSGVNWPSRGDMLKKYRFRGRRVPAAEQRFAKMIQQTSFEYFIITSLMELQVQKDLKWFLTKNFPVHHKTERYLVFDLTRRLSVGDSSSAAGAGSRHAPRAMLGQPARAVMVNPDGTSHLD